MKFVAGLLCFICQLSWLSGWRGVSLLPGPVELFQTWVSHSPQVLPSQSKCSTSLQQGYGKEHNLLEWAFNFFFLVIKLLLKYSFTLLDGFSEISIFSDPVGALKFIFFMRGEALSSYLTYAHNVYKLGIAIWLFRQHSGKIHKDLQDIL